MMKLSFKGLIVAVVMAWVWSTCVCLCLLVMGSDYASCLHMLMKYPPIADMQYFIDMARYLREPNVRRPLSTNSILTTTTIS